MACSHKFFAVGSSSGKVSVYNDMTCQEMQQLSHSEPVRTLQFGQTESVIASSGLKCIRLWDVDSWQQLWQQDIPRDCLSLCFADEDRLLIGALRNNRLMIWNGKSGIVSHSVDWTEDAEGQVNKAYRRPISAAISVESSLLAVVYRGQDILVWDIESNAVYETYAKETGANRHTAATTGVTAFVTGGLVFSSDPSANLLSASYSDGDLVVFDITEGTVKEKTLAYAQILASSSNGRTLAAADSTGRIQLFDFETLRLLHCISADDYGIKSLAFSGDSSRLLDIRGAKCRVWDPTALLRPDEVDESSDTVSVFTLPQETMLESTDDASLITALACHPNGGSLFCGKADGGVYLYESSSGLENQKLFNHANNVTVVALFYDSQSSILSSVDSSSRVMCHKLVPQDQTWRVDGPLFDHRVGTAIDQILCKNGGMQLLVSSMSRTVLYTIVQDADSKFTTTEMVERAHHRWAPHPLNPDQLVSMSSESINLYDWKNLQRLKIFDNISLEGKVLAQLSVESLIPCGQGRYLAAIFSESSATHSRPGPGRLVLWSTWALSVESSSTKSVSPYQVLTDQVQSLIGSYGQRLIFLRSNGWICSTDLILPNVDRSTRHFFIPMDWLSACANLIIDVTCNGDIIFVKRHEIAVIKRGLETTEQGSSAASARSPIRGGKRPPLASWKSAGSDNISLKPYPDQHRPSLPVRMTYVSPDLMP